MPVRQTYTYAELEVSKAAYDEIAGKLRAANYDHAFMDNGTIDMHGIGLINFVEHEAAGHVCVQPKNEGTPDYDAFDANQSKD